ncbi:hypothetical protein [Delftia sp. PS-11]|uniref:hypothetical protein n=1 Tax=Delftia sp. PS-11 TaxID=2767222 RepID=UPI0024557AD3|nr:hypothetical protein [Delftia sp. PS-11]KAJ8745418.1 hypothetical protein H9T68_06360 [Delftia sp. PS-11]
MVLFICAILSQHQKDSIPAKLLLRIEQNQAVPKGQKKRQGKFPASLVFEARGTNAYTG